MTSKSIQIEKVSRRKGGGRKFFDGKISRPSFVKSSRKWFSLNPSVKDFLIKNRISMQSYYRFLNKNPSLKTEINESRKNHVFQKKDNIKKLFAWLTENPEKQASDYYLRDIYNLSLPEITQSI